MLKTNCVQYLHDKAGDMELIFCENSVISYPLHNHISVFSIGLVICGSIILTAGNHSEVYESNHTFMVLPYIPHAIKAEKPYTLLTLCIGKDRVIHCDRERIRNNIQQLLVSVPDLQLTESQITQLLIALDFINGYSDLHFKQPCVGFIKSQLECFPEQRLSIEEMARTAYISKYHFVRSFKQSVGLTPHQFQIQNRVRKAQRLLNDVENIAEVASATGFCDQSHFIKHFEKYVGLTPAAYKMSCRQITSDYPS